MASLESLLDLTAARHAHLCPKQVLGVRMGLLAGGWLEIDIPQSLKRLLVIVETDGCFADGVSVATGCSVGHRTLRIEDYGKVAATFVDTQTERAVRIVPHPEARNRAREFAEDGLGRWQTQLMGYQRMPDDVLFSRREVRLATPIAALVSKPHMLSACQVCGEEIINERQVARDGLVLCRACAGHAYYHSIPDESTALRKLELPLGDTCGR